MDLSLHQLTVAQHGQTTHPQVLQVLPEFPQAMTALGLRPQLGVVVFIRPRTMARLGLVAH